MSVPYLSCLSPSGGTFSAIIAPAEDLQQALSMLLKRDVGLLLYLCGNYPRLLPGLGEFSDRFEVRRALTAFQILTILEESHHSFLVFEHDRSLYEERADLIPIIGQRCREFAAVNAGVYLIAEHPDRYLQALEPFFDRLYYIRQTTSAPAPQIRVRASRQQTLAGV